MTLDQRVGLYEACQQLSPIHPDYATLPIQEGFNWSSSLGDVGFEQLYLVVFRSVLRATADLELLYELDELAHAEAIEAGGLLFYFRGVINDRRESLSFCLWEDGSKHVGPPAVPRTGRRWASLSRRTNPTSWNATTWRTLEGRKVASSSDRAKGFCRLTTRVGPANLPEHLNSRAVRARHRHA